MNPIIKNVFVVIGGVAVGMIVNMGLVILGSKIIPAPEGIDPSNPESLKAGMELLKPKNFIFPFLAHALGTLSGAWFVGRAAASHNRQLAMIIGAFFLLGGIMMVMQIGGPTWFKALDLLVAYLPMAWLGGKIGYGNKF